MDEGPILVAVFVVGSRPTSSSGFILGELGWGMAVPASICAPEEVEFTSSFTGVSAVRAIS